MEIIDEIGDMKREERVDGDGESPDDVTHEGRNFCSVIGLTGMVTEPMTGSRMWHLLQIPCVFKTLISVPGISTICQSDNVVHSLTYLLS